MATLASLPTRDPDADWSLPGWIYTDPEFLELETARISVWMRTAQRSQVVKFRTFLRTLVHEFCHHLDYEHFKLAETFHTQGFYARESAMMREILGEAPKA